MMQKNTWYRHIIGGALLTFVLVLSACDPAPAQPAPPPPPADAPAAPAAPAVDAPAAETVPIDAELPRPSAIRATTLIGLNVEDSAGQNVGSVDDAFVLVANGEVQYVVVTASGMEGMFSDWMLPLPAQAVTISAERNSLIVGRDAIGLLDAPGFERDAWPDITTDDWDFDIRNFWADLVGEEPTPTPVAIEPVEEPTDEPVEEPVDEPDADATPTPVAEEEAIDDDEAMDEDADATPTPVAEEEAIDDDEAIDEETDATPTPVAEEEAIDEDEAVEEETDATPTPVAEEEAIDDDEAMDEEADATPTPVAEEEAIDEDADVTDTETVTETEAIDEEDMDVEATPVPAEEVDTDVVTDDDELMIRVPYAMSLDELLDFEIHDPNGENLGNVEDMVINWEDGRIKYLVLSFGGFLGLGERWFVFPWNELVFDPLNNAFVTNVTEEMLSDAPGIDRDNWPDFDAPNWDSQFQQFWD